MQNRKFKIILVVCFFSLFWINSVNAADVAKIGVANMQRVLETSNPGKSAQEQIKQQKDKMEIDLKEKGAEIEQIRQRLEREAMVMSKESREEKEREARIKLNDFKTLQKKYRNELQQLEKRLISQLREYHCPRRRDRHSAPGSYY